MELNKHEAVILEGFGDTYFEATERALEAYGRWESGRIYHRTTA